MPEPVAPDRRLPGRQQEARSNDSAVLAAAREVFSARGHDASMAEIARQAGVGVASIYRRYPTKEALVEALRVNAVSEAAALAREVARPTRIGCRTRRTPGAAPQGPWPLSSRGRSPAPPVRSCSPRAEATRSPPSWRPPQRSCARASNVLVARDQADGLLPHGFTTADVMQLLLHLRPALPLPRAQADALHLRYLDFAMRGLREQARAGLALSEGPHWDEWMGSWRD